MDSDCGSYLDQKPKLALKSSQIHVERLKKLKQKLSFQSPQVSNYTPSRRQSFANTKFTISRQTSNNLNPLDQSFKRQENTAPNKSNYFQSMNLKNIQSENKILYKKIQKIVKRKTTNLIAQQKNQQRKSNTTFGNYDESTQNDALNVTSDLAEDMIKNRATRAMIKQQEIRNENLKMLQRLMSLKPTIQTKKILNQTRKQQQISKRMSKFNTFHSIQSQNQKQQHEESMNILPKKLSVDYHNNNEPAYQIPENLTKKQHISSYNERTYRLMPDSPVVFKRTNTEPIEILQNTKLPSLSLTYTTNIYSFNSREKSHQEIRKRARSQNLKYLQTSKSFSIEKPQFQTTSFGYRSNAKIPECENSGKTNLFNAKKALEKQKVLSDRQINKSSPKKFILLGEIERKIQNLNVRFRFVRFNSYYEIQMREKKPVKKDKKAHNAQQNSKEYVASVKLKAHKSVSTPSSQPLGLKKIQTEKSSKTKKLKFPGGIISLQEQMGSAVFSSFDYDYHRIVEKCLIFDISKKDNTLNIEMKEEFRGSSKRIIYQQDSIRQNDQDEEQDSQDSVRQE